VFIILPGETVSSLLITCANKSSVERNYLPAIRLGGWTGPVLLVSAGDPVPSLEGVAGLLVPGGDDIHPRRWDPAEALHPAAQPDEPRDELEIPLVREAWRRGLPILGICRGEQLLNVAMGGSLIQDIPSQRGLDDGLHNRGTSQEADEAHRVAIAPGSRLAGLVGDTGATVNSRHHQAVLRVAPELRAVAWWRQSGTERVASRTELVEGIEAEDRWVVGVQWHPENLVRLDNGTGRAALGIFQGFAAALAGR
jgi:putative glutamine amidotransferase